MVGLQDEEMIVEKVLESLDSKVDPVALFFPYHSDPTIGYNVEVATDTIVGGVGLEDWCGGILQEIEFLAVGDSLLAVLKGS